MKQTYVNYFVDWIIFLAMFLLFGTGLVLWGWKRPPATGSPNVPPNAVAKVHPESKPGDNSVESSIAKSTALTGEKNDIKAPESAPQKKQMAGPASQPQGLILWGLFRGNTFLGMTKNGGWKSIHCWVAMLVLLPFMLLHVLLHFKWIVHVTASLFAPKKAVPSSEPNDKPGVSAELH